MALKIGTQAPNFKLPATGNKQFELEKDFKGQACIIYFYPKDFTPGCTQDACDFRDNFSFFKNLDIPIVGISRDTIKTHEEFKAANQLPFDLLSDKSGDVCAAYKALIPILKVPKRVTYLLDANHQIKAIYDDLFGARKHIMQMIEEVQKA